MPFIGEIKLFAGNYAPAGYAFCNGQTLAASAYPALLSVIGTAYGGNGITTFRLPDLRSRVPVGAGTGPGLSTVPLGFQFGVEQWSYDVEVSSNQMLDIDIPATAVPSFTPQVEFAGASTNPQSRILLDAGLSFSDPADAVGVQEMDLNTFPGVTPSSGAGAPTTVQVPVELTATGTLTVHKHQPSLGVSYIIAIEGDYPARS